MTAPARKAKPAAGAHPWPIREPGAVIDAVADVVGIDAARVEAILRQDGRRPDEPELYWYIVGEAVARAAAWLVGGEIDDEYEDVIDYLVELLDSDSFSAHLVGTNGQLLLPQLAQRVTNYLAERETDPHKVKTPELVRLAALAPVLIVQDFPTLNGSREERAARGAEMVRQAKVYAVAGDEETAWPRMLEKAQSGNVVQLAAVAGGKAAPGGNVPVGSFLVAEARHLIADLAAEGRPLRGAQAFVLLELADAVHDGHGQFYGSWERIADKVAEDYRTVTRWRDQLAGVTVARDGKSWPLLVNVGWVKENRSKLDTWQLFPWLFPETKRGKKKRPGAQRRPQRGDGGRFTR
jgi:hypothetical protein